MVEKEEGARTGSRELSKADFNADVEADFTVLTVQGAENRLFWTEYKEYFESASKYLKTMTEDINLPAGQNALRVDQLGGRTTLHRLACEDLPYAVSLLVNHGADIDATDPHDRTPLMEASFWGRVDTVVFLLLNHANFSLKDNMGYSALDLAMPSDRMDEERDFFNNDQTKLISQCGGKVTRRKQVDSLSNFYLGLTTIDPERDEVCSLYA